MIVQVNTLEDPFLNVNCDHLRQYNQELYGQLVRYPQEVIPTFDMGTNELFQHLYPDTCLEHQIQVSIMLVLLMLSLYIVLISNFDFVCIKIILFYANTGVTQNK